MRKILRRYFSDTFLGWQYLHNYSHHRLGRIWVFWSDDLEALPVIVSSQMIFGYGEIFDDTEDIFLASFIYSSKCMIEQREL